MNEDQVKTHNFKITLEGELMEGGSVEYKTLFGVIDGTASSIERLAKLTSFERPVTFYVTPPKEKCFEITLQITEWIGAAIALLPQAPTIKDVVAILVEYIKIKKALKGEKLTKDKIQTNENGQTIVKNKNGDVIYNDNRRIVNQNIIIASSEDSSLNKKIDKIGEALEQSKRADKLLFGEDEENTVSVTKEEVQYLKYEEEIEERTDQLVGTIRQINNKTNKGIFVIKDGDSDRAVHFELDIEDIGKLDSTVRNLAIAEGTGSRVVFIGEKQLDSEGKLKRIIVNTVEVPDKSFDF